MGGQLHPPFTSAPGSVSPNDPTSKVQMLPTYLQAELSIPGGIPFHLSSQEQSPAMPVKLFMERYGSFHLPAAQYEYQQIPTCSLSPGFTNRVKT